MNANNNAQFLWAIILFNLLFLFIWLIRRFFNTKASNGRETKALKKRVLNFILVEYFICLAALTIVPLPSSKGFAGYLNLDFYHQTYNNLLSAINHTSNRKVWTELENILGNIVLFLPFGVLLPIRFKKCRNFFIIFFWGFLASFSIEAIQYYWSTEWHYGRVSDIDDVALNLIGTVIGFLVFLIFKNMLLKKISFSKL